MPIVKTCRSDLLIKVASLHNPVITYCTMLADDCVSSRSYVLAYGESLRSSILFE